MKKRKKLSIMRVFVFAIIIITTIVSTTIVNENENNLLALEEVPYYEGKYNSINSVANLLDKIDKENILISPFNFNSTLAGLYNYDDNLKSYFQESKENVNNNYLSKMTKYKKNLKNMTKKELFYESKIQKFYEKQYNTLTIRDLNKTGNNDKRKMIDLINTILLTEESLTNKNITLKQLKKYKPREIDYNINNQTLINKINTINWQYNLYIKKNYIINISNLYYNQEKDLLDLNFIKDKYLFDIQNLETKNEKKINNDIYNNSNKQINYIVEDKDIQTDALITSSLVFNYKWDTVIESNKNTYDDFYINDDIKTVEMLNFTSTNYLENEMAQGFIKDYENNTYSFVGILPKSNYKLSSINIENLLNSKIEINTNVSIPKFSITDSNNLIELSNLKFLSLSNDINTNKYYQKNTFSFKEAGTYDFDSKSIISNNIATLSSVDNIIFNHPFYFMIIDNDNNSILLAGKITDPNI